jgi:biotin carboxylase
MKIAMIGMGTPLHAALKRNGAEVYLFAHADDLKYVYPSHYELVVGVRPDSRPNAWVTTVEAIDHTACFDSIICVHERAVVHYGAVVERLGRGWLRPETVAITTDKFAMREALDDVAFGLVDSPQQVEAFMRRVASPIILKPVDGRGSQGILKFDAPTEIAKSAVLDRAFRVGSLLAEEYVEGREYSVEAISVQGHHRILGITKKFKLKDSFVEEGHCFPAPDLSENETSAIHRRVEATLDRLGVQDGPTHTEVIIAAERMHIVETHCRCGGDSIPELVQIATGVDMLDFTAKYILRRVGSLPEAAPPQCFAAIWFLTSCRQGQVRSLPDLREFVGGAHSHGIKLSVGQTLQPTIDSFSRLGHVIFSADSGDVCVQRARASIAAITSAIVVS